MAAHPYCFPALPGAPACTGWNDLDARTNSFRSVMKGHGDGATTIWVTESGAPTRGARKVSEDDQRKAVARGFNQVRGAAWGGPVIVYSAQDRQAYGTSDDSENYFGLVRFSGERKPAATEFARYAKGFGRG